MLFFVGIVLMVLILVNLIIEMIIKGSNKIQPIYTNIDINKLCMNITEDNESGTDFERAVLSGKIQKVVELNRSTTIGYTEFVKAFSCAVAIEDKDIINWMLNTKPEYRHELLQYGFITATLYGSRVMVECIIAYDKDMYVRNNWYVTGLHYAVLSESSETIKYMVSRNYNRCFTTREDVVFLCRKGHFDSAKTLYKVYRKNNQKDKYIEDAIKTKNDSYL